MLMVVMTSTPHDLCAVDDFLGKITLLNNGKIVFDDKILNIK